MHYDAIIIGAGAAGLMCAVSYYQKHGADKKLLILEKNTKIAKKIRISGGGKCNFSNTHPTAQNYLSHNRHFVKSALSRFSTDDFIALLDKYHIPWQQRQHGQLFGIENAGHIVDMLRKECTPAHILTGQMITNIGYDGTYYHITSNDIIYSSTHIVIATGSPAVPKMGATSFAESVAQQFGLATYSFIPALVPLVFSARDARLFQDLSGVSFSAKVCCGKNCFTEQVLITHKGLSGPAILQISSYWQKGKSITLNFLPHYNILDELVTLKQKGSKTTVKTVLKQYLPSRLVTFYFSFLFGNILDKALVDSSNSNLQNIATIVHSFAFIPAGNEGLRVAEACGGGVDTRELSSQTMMSNKQANLYFIGECVDVVGWLGGYNFAWAWASGWVCGQHL